MMIMVLHIPVPLRPLKQGLVGWRHVGNREAFWASTCLMGLVRQKVVRMHAKIIRYLALGCWALALSMPGPAQAACRMALVLGMDISASVDAREYDLQMQGTASSLLSPAVVVALLQGQPVALSAFLWGGATEQQRITDWVLIEDRAVLEQFAARIAATPRPPFRGRTGTGAAMRFGAAMLRRAPDCVRSVLDIATDGERNDGVQPRDVRMGDVTVNALSIGGDIPFDHGDAGEPLRPLSAWLERNVIRGDAAFVEKALDYSDFERAMRRKLLRELEAMFAQADILLPQ